MQGGRPRHGDVGHPLAGKTGWTFGPLARAIRSGSLVVGKPAPQGLCSGRPEERLLESETTEIRMRKSLINKAFASDALMGLSGNLLAFRGL